MENIQVTVAGVPVIASGSVVIPKKQSVVQFLVRDLLIECRFTSDKSKEKQIKRELLQDAKLAVFDFVNFNDPLGTSFHSSIGTLDDKRLFFTLYVHALSKGGPRLVNYTFSVAPYEVVEGHP